MDTNNDRKIPECGILADLRKNRVVAGAKQLRKAMENGRARCVYLAENADPAITEPIRERCESSRIPYRWVSTMHVLGSACGIEVGAAAAAVIE
jgi:large subunit ribosomal protein L7A